MVSWPGAGRPDGVLCGWWTGRRGRSQAVKQASACRAALSQPAHAVVTPNPLPAGLSGDSGEKRVTSTGSIRYAAWTRSEWAASAAVEGRGGGMGGRGRSAWDGSALGATLAWSLTAQVCMDWQRREEGGQQGRCQHAVGCTASPPPAAEAPRPACVSVDPAAAQEPAMPSPALLALTCEGQRGDLAAAAVPRSDQPPHIRQAVQRRCYIIRLVSDPLQGAGGQVQDAGLEPPHETQVHKSGRAHVAAGQCRMTAPQPAMYITCVTHPHRLPTLPPTRAISGTSATSDATVVPAEGGLEGLATRVTSQASVAGRECY